VDVHGSPAIIVSGPERTSVLAGPECAVLGRQLADAIKYGYTARGTVAPRVLLDFAITVNRAARGSASSAVPPTSAVAAELRNPGDGAVLPSSGEPVATLTVAEAARVAEVSDRYVRKLIQRGSVEALRGHRGTLLVRIDSLAAWLEARSRKENERRAA
jgi:excisionase family DNA binding protein